MSSGASSSYAVLDGESRDLIRDICRHDIEALDLLDRALQNPPALHNVQGNAPTGNRGDRALRKLRKDAPDLHAAVFAAGADPSVWPRALVGAQRVVGLLDGR